MENASWSGTVWGKRLVHSLTKCIEIDAPLSAGEKQFSRTAKERGLALYTLEKGDSCQVFDARLLAE